MTALERFLDEHAVKNQEAMAQIAEWRTSVVNLFNRIRKWLEASDPKKIMQIIESELEINEPGIGRYHVPQLSLGLLGNWVEIVPRARRVNGIVRPNQPSASQCSGRVDITDQVHRFVLFRFNEGDKDEWFIQDPTEGPMVSAWAKPPLLPFDWESFEKALLRCFR